MEAITPENLITLAITLAIIATLLAIGHALDKYETRRAKAAAAKAEAAAKPKTRRLPPPAQHAGRQHPGAPLADRARAHRPPPRNAQHQHRRQ